MTESEVLVALIRFGLTRGDAKQVYEQSKSGIETGFQWWNLDGKVIVMGDSKRPQCVRSQEDLIRQDRILNAGPYECDR